MVKRWYPVQVHIKQRAVVSVGSYHGRRSLVITGSGQREAGGSRDIRSGDGAGSALHSCELYDRWELVSYSGVVVYDGSMFDESLLFMMVQCLWIVLMTLIHWFSSSWTWFWLLYSQKLFFILDWLYTHKVKSTPKAYFLTINFVSIDL